MLGLSPGVLVGARPNRASPCRTNDDRAQSRGLPWLYPALSDTFRAPTLIGRFGYTVGWSRPRAASGSTPASHQQGDAHDPVAPLATSSTRGHPPPSMSNSAVRPRAVQLS